MDDFTFQYNDGPLLNDEFLPGEPFVDINKVTGLDSGEYRVSERSREGGSGGFLDTGFTNMRTVILEGTAYGDEPYLESLRLNWRPYKEGRDSVGGGAVLKWGVDGLQRMVRGRSLGVKYDWEQMRRTGQTAIQFQVRCEDPTIYSSVVNTFGPMTLLPITVPGYAYNRAYNRTYGGGITGGAGSNVFNGGNATTYPDITINGPCANPFLINDSWPSINLPRIKLAGTLGVGDSVVISMRNHTVKLNGTANRRTWVLAPYVWWGLVAGNNFIRFGADTLSGAEAFLTYSDAFE